MVANDPSREMRARYCRSPSHPDSIGYPRMSASGESSTTMHRLLHASRSHPIPTPYDPKETATEFAPPADLETLTGELVGSTEELLEHQSTGAPPVALDIFEISFMASPSGPRALEVIHHMVPNKDFDLVPRNPDL
ncbi:hypothetical protein F511_28448 [Dorcoceras hygrometricum]|uniref:Uncharacterized protein n=1 Tax=Dorcoceras hygrometricum TaxID=472368 RepID=A0A2Z7AMY2_9LAMI|nr:hypothetical protein F511_28448 [Dorcoceras hygrometricum]